MTDNWLRVALCLTGTLLSLGDAAPGEVPPSSLARYELPCPICKQPFTTVGCTGANTGAGVDLDLFARSIGPQPEFYRVSTCPRCGYSGYESDFSDDVDIPPDVSQRILESSRLTLPEGFGPQSNPRDLDAADRYRLAITCYQWRGKPDKALAWLNLRASWVCRDEGSMLPPEPRLASVLKYLERYRPRKEPRTNQFDVEMQMVARTAEALAVGEFNRYQKPYVELALAMILRRHGENRQAGKLLSNLAAKGDWPENLASGIKRMRQSIEVEQQYQTEATRLFERALLAEQISPPNLGPALYLLGELHRRLGDDRAAVAWFDRAIRSPDTPPDLLKWAAQQRAWAAGQLDVEPAH